LYDINNNVWVDPELSHEIPRWYHSAIVVPAIPSWKYFVFGGSIGNFEEGGNRTTSRMTDDAYVLDIPDIKNMKWYPINIVGERPKARESSALFYDNNDSKLILFGGWSNNWLGDTYSLKVSMITGPPYAIYNITPNMGPLTGKTKVLIDGDGFKDTNNIIVRFDSHSKATSPEVQGVFISET